MSLDTGSIVSCMGIYMMTVLVGSLDDGVGRSVIISKGVSSDGDWELMNLISISTSPRNGWSTSMNVWSATGVSGGY